MLFEVSMEESKLMSNIISIISSIVAESRMQVTKDGIKIKAFDATRISLIDLNLQSSAFSSFNVKEETFVGLNLETLNTILKTAKSDESLVFSFDDKAMRFKIDFIGKKRKRSFSLSHLDLTEENVPDTINLDFDANFTLQSSFIQQVIKDAEMVSDYLNISASGTALEFSAKSENKDTKTVIQPDSDEVETDSFQVLEDSNSFYSLDFLAKFLKGIRSTDKVKLSFSGEQPLRFIYEIEGKGYLVYFVAPRIEDSEDIDEEF